MDFQTLIHNFLNLDETLGQLTQQWGTQIYALLFAIVFCETGLVFLPFLPGDSLLFTAGALAATNKLNPAILYPLFITAALLGDNVNYWIGRKFGRKLFGNENSKIFKRSNLTKTEVFFDKYGGKAIIMARFVPIVRTFAPFVAGMGAMPYVRFLYYSVMGAFIWVGVCVTAGLLFGNLPFVKKRFELMVIGVILISLIPILLEIINHKRAQKKQATPEPSAH